MSKRKGNITPELDKLFTEAGVYRSSKDYRELLNFVRRFKTLAPYNAMLVHVQKPGSKYIASAEDWKEKFGRKPKPGARPLVILRTFGPVSFVYELNDTEGRDFPEEIQNPFKAEGIFTDSDLKEFIEKKLYFNGFGFYRVNYGTERAGQVQVVNSFGRYNNNQRFKLPFAITVNNNLDAVTQLTTIYHELGHVYCGHLYNPEIQYLPQRYNLNLSYNVKEFEAESVCWLLCERQGIKNPSAAYLSGYLDNNSEIPDISIDTVLKAVAAIEQIRDNKIFSPRKELRLSSE